MTAKLKKHLPFIFFLSIYAYYSYDSLLIFPFVHSDEIWLGGLSQTFLAEGKLLVSEPFFDLFPRYPHLMKVFFHLLQTIFIQLFGYRLFSFRLLSYIVSLFCIIIFYRLVEKRYQTSSLGPLFTISLVICLATTNQFLYSAHFARQEILLLLIVCWGISLFLRPSLSLNSKVFRLALLTGLAVGIHPNSFLVCLSFAGLLLSDTINRPLVSLKTLSLYGLLSGALASLYLIGSHYHDPNFIQHYLSYGQSQGVTRSFTTKCLAFGDFYKNIFHRISGTYYLPDIRFWIVIGLFIMLIATIWLVFSFFRHHSLASPFWLPLITFHIGLIVLGRYNTTCIILYFPYLILLAADGLNTCQALINSLPRTSITSVKPTLVINASLLLIIIFNLWQTTISINEFANYPYTNFQTQLEQIIDLPLTDNEKILGNLNAGLLVKPDQFIDYRNLAFLPNEPNALSKYLSHHHIGYILYYEELDYLHRNPEWQLLYGSDKTYYQALQTFLDQQAEKKGTITSPVYGSRIVRYMKSYPWKVTVYRVTSP